MKLFIGTPSTGFVRATFAFSLAYFVSYFAGHRIRPEHDNQEIGFISIEGSMIGENRDLIVEEFLKQGGSHLLFIDDDMGFAMNAVHVLASKRQPIVGVTYRMKNPPSPFTAIHINGKDRIETSADKTGLEEAKCIGMGLTLIEKEVFESMTRPRYLTTFNEDIQKYSTEDMWFCNKARDAGYKVYVDHDASKLVIHQGSINYVWDKDYKTLETESRKIIEI